MTTFAAPLDPDVTFGDVFEADLTPRELDVIRLITQGMSNREIADSLFLSVNSVKSYVQVAYRKIDATSRSQAVLWGARHGLLDGVVAGRLSA